MTQCNFIGRLISGFPAPLLLRSCSELTLQVKNMSFADSVLGLLLTFHHVIVLGCIPVHPLSTAGAAALTLALLLRFRFHSRLRVQS